MLPLQVTPLHNSGSHHGSYTYENRLDHHVGISLLSHRGHCTPLLVLLFWLLTCMLFSITTWCTSGPKGRLVSRTLKINFISNEGCGAPLYSTRQTTHGRPVNNLVALNKNATNFHFVIPNIGKIIEFYNSLVWWFLPQFSASKNPRLSYWPPQGSDLILYNLPLSKYYLFKHYFAINVTFFMLPWNIHQ